MSIVTKFTKPVNISFLIKISKMRIDIMQFNHVILSQVMSLGRTFVNFSYCELEGRWERVSGMSSDTEIYEAMEDDAKINTRTFSEEKTHYYMKKGAKIIIKDHVLKFDKTELA